ncbi:MAG: triosephosphate isomerase (TIM) [Microgenomates group bacterium Gr01-1014_93]|nr:MAG: triosephosphate isomerase (TIM) [Microgenomates group bacterium Gr01-1014_93]
MDGSDKNRWIIANWKDNKTIAEALDWISQVGPKLEKRENIKVVVCPTFTAIEEVKKAVMVGNFPIMVGAQDLSPYPEGAFTGEEAAGILKQFVDLAIIGHSERRQKFNETDEIIAQKVKQALNHQIIPLVCVQNGETLVPEGVKLIAYEPIFAISTDNPDSPENAEKVAETFKQKYGDELEVLYGGSVTSENIGGFLNRGNLNGVLVGGASLGAEEFLKIIYAAH